jgi:hypothetical protein
VTVGVSGTSPPNPLAVFLGEIKLRDWNGQNGKFETIGGSQRVKWNDLTLAGRTYSCRQPYFKMKDVFIPTGEILLWNMGVSWNNQLITFSHYPLSGNLQLKVFSRLLEQVKDHEFNLGVDSGQCKQTVGLLSENLGRLGRAALSVSRGNFPAAARALGASARKKKFSTSEISSRWLELQYGWLPLLSSSYEAAKAFAKISEGPRTVRYKATAKEAFNLERRRT